MPSLCLSKVWSCSWSPCGISSLVLSIATDNNYKITAPGPNTRKRPASAKCNPTADAQIYKHLSSQYSRLYRPIPMVLKGSAHRTNCSHSTPHPPAWPGTCNLGGRSSSSSSRWALDCDLLISSRLRRAKHGAGQLVWTLLVCGAGRVMRSQLLPILHLPLPPSSGRSISFQSYFRWADLNSQADICQPEDEEKYLVVEINRTVFSSKTLISLGFLFCFEQGKCKII